MIRFVFAIVASVLASQAFAQPQPQPQRLTAVQMLSTQIGTLAVQNAMSAEQIATLQEQLEAARVRIKELEAKLPKPEAEEKN